MPKIKIKRGSQTSSSKPTLDDGELYLADDGGGEGKLYAGTSDGDTNTDKVRVKYSDNSNYSAKIGTESSHGAIGGDTDEDGGSGGHYGLKPVYVNSNGEITAATGSHGNSTTPVYVEDGGIRRCNGSVGGNTPTTTENPSGGYKPVHMGSGSIIGSSANLGNIDNPVFMQDGSIRPISGVYEDDNQHAANVFGADEGYGGEYYPVYVSATHSQDNPYIVYGLKHSPKYAGGTKMTVNGTNYGANDKSVYAPTTSGSTGRLLFSRGSGNAPAWSQSSGSVGQILVSNGNGNDPEWKNCPRLPFTESSTISVSDNGIYIVTVRATSGSSSTDITALLAITDKNKVCVSSELRVILGGNTASFCVKRDAGLGAVELSILQLSYYPDVSTQIIGAYKLSD